MSLRIRPVARLCITASGLFLLVSFFLQVVPARAGDPGSDAMRLSGAAEAMIDFYQTFISPADGDRCPMHPSCSRYALEAAQSHGLFLGWIMACDRLVRCGGDEIRFSGTCSIDGRRLIRDPVANNDFWWIRKGNER